MLAHVLCNHLGSVSAVASTFPRVLTLWSAQNFDTYVCAVGMLAVVLRKRRGFVSRTGAIDRFLHASDGHFFATFPQSDRRFAGKPKRTGTHRQRCTTAGLAREMQASFNGK